MQTTQELLFEFEKNGKMNEKVEAHKIILEKMHQVYIDKNSDYGDSFSNVRKKYPNAILIRLNDKLNRLEKLYEKGYEAKVKNESVNDTLLDIANYCIMEIMENNSEFKLPKHPLSQQKNG